MPAGQLHYRVGGRAFVREPGDRRLFAEVLRWDKPVKLSWGGMEWFTRDREPPASRPSPELPGWCGPQPHNGGFPLYRRAGSTWRLLR